MSEMVPLHEVNAQLGGTEDLLPSLMRREGVEAASDWAGRPAVKAEVAARLISTWRTEQASSALKWSAYQRYLATREQERYQVGERAFSEAAKRRLELEEKHGEEIFLTPRTLSPAGRQVAREARARALEEYDKKQKPPVSFEKFDG